MYNVYFMVRDWDEQRLCDIAHDKLYGFSVKQNSVSVKRDV